MISCSFTFDTASCICCYTFPLFKVLVYAVCFSSEVVCLFDFSCFSNFLFGVLHEISTVQAN